MDLEHGTIIQGDSLEIMRSLRDLSVDAIITDPPYGQKAGKLGALRGTKSSTSIAKRTDYGNFIWDNERPARECFEHIRRLARVQVIFGGNFFADLLPPSRCWVCWDKGRRKDFADCELIWTNLDKPARVLNWHYDGCMMASRQYNKRVHPTQKPVQVMQWLIEKYTNPGDLILDPFCGSGSTLVAAQLSGRRWVGIDLSEEYCAIARERIAALSPQTSMR
jgi:DNA modification methylase